MIPDKRINIAEKIQVTEDSSFRKIVNKFEILHEQAKIIQRQSEIDSLQIEGIGVDPKIIKSSSKKWIKYISHS